jgi:8-amino-7-oxononanoate synthase
MTTPGLAFLDAALEEARGHGLLRERTRGGPRGKSFCSNDYLDLAHQVPPLESAGAGASRLVDGDRAIHSRLEEDAASLVGQPSALAFTSGYAANVGLLSALAGLDDLIVSDALNHASLIDGARLSRARVRVVPHLDVDAVRIALGTGNRVRRRFVVTESYFSMDADSPDLQALRRVCDDHGAALVVDEAHALGVLGPDGGGLCAAAGVKADATVGTFGKAFGAGGAFVAGCASLTSWLWNRARSFVFSTGLSPVVAAAALQGITTARDEPHRRERALSASTQLRAGLGACGVQPLGFGQIVPWIIGDAGAAVLLSAGLADLGFHVRAIRPPSVPSGTARLRFTTTAAHDREDIEQLLSAIRRLRLLR